MHVANYKSIFSTDPDQCVCKLAWDKDHALWAWTGKQTLYKLDQSFRRRTIVNENCRLFSLSENYLAYVTDSDKVIVLTIQTFSKVSEFQCDKRVHEICFANDLVVISTHARLIVWNFLNSECSIINHEAIVAMDMCVFPTPNQLVISEWNLYAVNLPTENVRMLQSREYDLEYPFDSAIPLDDERLCVNSSCLEIYDRTFKCIASSTSIRSVASVFLGDNTIMVREGGCQDQSSRREEDFLDLYDSDQKGYRIIIAAYSNAFAFDREIGALAVSGQGKLTVMDTED